MDRAAKLSGGIWGATSWLLSFLGASAFFTVGTRLGAGGDQSALIFPGLATFAVLLAAAGQWLVGVITTSRKREGDSAARRRGVAYVILGVLVLVQVAAMPVAALFQGLAVQQVLSGPSATALLNENLARRLDPYASGPKLTAPFDPVDLALAKAQLDQVLSYCKAHRDESAASSDFLAACMFMSVSTQALPVPNPDFAKTFADRLRAKATGTPRAGQ